jgi:GGDEF domain-containing protein
MSMMNALFGKSNGSEQATLACLAKELSRCFAEHRIEGREEDREVLLANLGDCEAKIDRSSRPAEIIEAAESMMMAYATYTRETAEHLQETRGKIERLVELMNCTVGMVFAGSEEALGEVSGFERDLERAIATNSTRAYQPRFKERLASMRKRAEKHREQVERAMTMSAAVFPHLKPAQLVEAEKSAAEAAKRQEAEIAPPATGEPDPLTGLPTRSDAEQALARLIESSANAHFVAVVIDQMSMITHRYGNATAEDVVLFYAQLLGQNLRPIEITYRWNDRCFLCVLHRAEQKHVLRDQLNWFLCTRYKRNMKIDNRSAMLNVGASFKIWHATEFRAAAQFAQALDSHLDAVAA